MKTFNLNDNILVSITPYGWECALKAVGQSYLDACIIPKKHTIDNIDYYKMQAHELFILFSKALFMTHPCPINMNILIPE